MKKWRTFGLKSLLIVTAITACIVAWRIHEYEHGTINRWVDAVLADQESNPLSSTTLAKNFPRAPQAPVVPCPVDITPKQQTHLLLKSLRWLPSAERRNCVLKIIAEQFPDEAHDLSVRISKETDHEILKCNAIRLASLFRFEKDIAEFEKYLDDESSLVRSAAIDAIGIIHNPSFPIPAGFDNIALGPIAVLDSEPQINLARLAKKIIPQPGPSATPRGGTQLHGEHSAKRKLSTGTKEKIQQLLLTDLDPKVRSAAARAARNWNPKEYKLRVAEWGVWINEGENLTLAQSIIDEIPPFVHRVGNDMTSIQEGRTNSLIMVTKPIIHFTVDQPLVIDVSVRINSGRPWFGYPMPDNFAVSGTTGQYGDPKHLARDVPSNLNLDPLKDLHEGYPWILPAHTKHYITTVTDVGFCWQSLMVFPQQLDWMDLEPITDKKFAWWSRLRKVDSSWVSNRGESERFLYYDGPTEYPSPVKASIDAEQLTVGIPQAFYFQPEKRTYLLIDVSDNKIQASKSIPRFGRFKKSIQIPTTKLPLEDKAVEEQLLATLIEYGLNSEEANGLIDCWRPQFFKTPGRRLLTIFDKKEYGKLCPISISPKPTELSRVGIVLTEFGEYQPERASE